jgi:hypothetical protein
MDNDERDRLIIETHRDVAWLKEWTVEHKQTHSKYIYYLVTCFVACVLSWFR